MKRKSKLPLPLLLFIILIGVTLLLCGAALCVWLHGRNELRGKPQNAPLLERSEPSGESSPESGGAGTTALLGSYTVLRNGKYYRYRSGMINLLLLGIDSENKPGEPLPYGDGNQADVIIIAALDTDGNKMTLISVSRDTVCPISVPDGNGGFGVDDVQIALSYAYGDGLDESCKLCREAVSGLFHGLQLDGYVSFYMGGVAELNDAVGGVTLTVLDDVSFADIEGCSGLIPGKEVTLTGEQAMKYVRLRRSDTTGNADRMKRQKQYLLAMISQTRQRLASNPAWALTLYSSLSRYLLTDLDLSRISYLATQVARMDFTGDIRSVTGESVLGAGDHMELTVDEEALYDLILDVFYEEITPETE